MDGLPPPLQQQPPPRPRALLSLLRRLAVRLSLPLRATLSRRRHRATPAANAAVPVAEAAVGAGQPLRAEAVLVTRLPRLHTRPLAGGTRINRLRFRSRNGSPLGGLFCSRGNNLRYGPGKEKSCPRSRRPRCDRRTHPRTSHTSPIPVFLRLSRSAP